MSGCEAPNSQAKVLPYCSNAATVLTEALEAREGRTEETESKGLPEIVAALVLFIIMLRDGMERSDLCLEYSTHAKVMW